MPPFYLVLNEVQVHLKRITSSFKIKFICFAIEFLFITPPKIRLSVLLHMFLNSLHFQKGYIPIHKLNINKPIILQLKQHIGHKYN